jgi:hypothetical protein
LCKIYSLLFGHAGTKLIIMEIIQSMGICCHIIGLLFDIDVLTV